MTASPLLVVVPLRMSTMMQREMAAAVVLLRPSMMVARPQVGGRARERDRWGGGRNLAVSPDPTSMMVVPALERSSATSLGGCSHLSMGSR